MQRRQSPAVVLLGMMLVAVTGCATLPSPEAIKAEVAGYQLPKLPEPGKAIVYVVRPSALGTLVRFNVFVDDQEANSEMGYNRGSQYIYFNITPGEHTILSKAENWAELRVTASAGDIFYIQQDAEMGLIMARNSILRLADDVGKYHVKKLTLGTILRAEKGQAEQALAPPPATATAPVSQAQPQVPGVAPVSPQAERLLRADELGRHVSSVSQFNGQLSNGTKVKFEWTWGNGFAVSSLQSADRITGTRSLEGGQVCTRLSNALAYRPNDLLPMGNNACYDVYELGAGRYVWRTKRPAEGAVLSYTLP